MEIKKIHTKIQGLYIIKNTEHTDNRGTFKESWNKEVYSKHGLIAEFTQDNISISKKNVIRGLHFQEEPFAQTKYIKVLKGKIIDVVVDIRKDSVTFGHHLSIELSDKNNLSLWIPSGLAHGFLSMEEGTIVSYKCTNKYSPKHERTIYWNDSEIGVKWGVKNAIISNKDNIGISLKEYKSRL